MKLTTMLPFAWAAAAAAAALSSRDDGANKTIAIKDITLTFCTQWGANSSCQTANLHHGHCYDFITFDENMHNNVEELSVLDGRCVLYDHWDCSGGHTGVFTGQHLHTDLLCPGREWHKKATAVKCCQGDPTAEWCSPREKHPKCKGAH